MEAQHGHACTNRAVGGEYLCNHNHPAVFMADARKRLRALEQDIRKFAQRIKRVLGPMMLACDVNELIAAEVTMRLRQIRHIADLLKARKR